MNYIWVVIIKDLKQFKTFIIIVLSNFGMMIMYNYQLIYIDTKVMVMVIAATKKAKKWIYNFILLIHNSQNNKAIEAKHKNCKNNKINFNW